MLFVHSSHLVTMSMFPSYVSQYLPTYIGSCRQGSVMWTLEVVVESFLQFTIFGFNQRFSFASDNFQKKFHTQKNYSFANCQTLPWKVS